MHNRQVRNWVFFLIVLLLVFFARATAINLLFSIWVGGWVMAKLFKYLFNFANDSANLTFDKFILNPHSIVFDLMAGSERKRTSLVVTWWSAGILTTIVIYKLLALLLLS